MSMTNEQEAWLQDAWEDFDSYLALENYSNVEKVIEAVEGNGYKQEGFNMRLAWSRNITRPSTEEMVADKVRDDVEREHELDITE